MKKPLSHTSPSKSNSFIVRMSWEDAWDMGHRNNDPIAEAARQVPLVREKAEQTHRQEMAENPGTDTFHGGRKKQNGVRGK